MGKTVRSFDVESVNFADLRIVGSYAMVVSCHRSEAAAIRAARRLAAGCSPAVAVRVIERVERVVDVFRGRG